MRNPLEPLAGFGVTFSSMFKKNNTELYPEEKAPTAATVMARRRVRVVRKLMSIEDTGDEGVNKWYGREFRITISGIS